MQRNTPSPRGREASRTRVAAQPGSSSAVAPDRTPDPAFRAHVCTVSTEEKGPAANAAEHRVSSLTYRCPVDGDCCEVIGLFRGELVRALTTRPELHRAIAKATSRHLGPGICGHCREVDHSLAVLPGTRLGPRSREILLEAAESELRLRRQSLSRNSYEARRAAAWRLCQAGLLRADRDFCTEVWGSRRVFVPTPLGFAVVDLFGDDLRQGRRIRWAPPHRDELRQQSRRSPMALLEMLREDLVRSIRMSAAFAPLAARLRWKTNAEVGAARALLLAAVTRALKTVTD
jgi:hypothetical protein